MEAVESSWTPLAEMIDVDLGVSKPDGADVTKEALFKLSRNWRMAFEDRLIPNIPSFQAFHFQYSNNAYRFSKFQAHVM